MELSQYCKGVNFRDILYIFTNKNISINIKNVQRGCCETMDLIGWLTAIFSIYAT